MIILGLIALLIFIYKDKGTVHSLIYQDDARRTLPQSDREQSPLSFLFGL